MSSTQPGRSPAPDVEGGKIEAAPEEAPKPRYTGNHPVAALFHILFKLGAVLAYIFCGLFSDSFVINFVIITLLLAFDFWTVKNVTGRLLVGLRWWNDVKDDGTNEWVFESTEDRTTIASIDKYIFWGALLLTPVLWGLFALSALLKLSIQWLLLVILALSLNCANIVGYIKCSKEARGKASQMSSGLASLQAVSKVAGMFASATSSSK